MPAPPPLPGLRDTELYLDFFGQPLDFAVFAHKSRRPLAIGSGNNSKSKARERICEQICVGASHPQWIHRPVVDQLGILFAYLPHKIGDCRLPICVGPTMTSQLFARWRSITDLRIAKNKWPHASDDPNKWGPSGLAAPREVDQGIVLPLPKCAICFLPRRECV